MRYGRESRPIIVSVIAGVLGLMAILQITILSWLLATTAASPPLRSAVSSLSAFDWISLYGLSSVLLISMALFHRLSRRSISWFTAYVGFSSWVLVAYVVAGNRPAHFDELVSLGGLLAALAVLGYMLRLRKQGKLA